MSEKLRKAIGLIMIILSIIACIIPVFHSNKQRIIRYRSAGEYQQWAIKEIQTEKNGSVRVNAADREEMTALRGIGESLAALIIEERENNGPFYYAEDLEAVKGIGPGTLERFRKDIDLTIDESR